MVLDWQVVMAQITGTDLFKNVSLPTEDGTTQIDHVLVSEFGVFVVETKNMKGWIFGGPHQRCLAQEIYRSKGEVH